MITKNDCFLLLYEIKSEGVDTKEAMSKLLSSSTPDTSVIKFIHEHRPIEVIEFYHKLRKSYNDKKSKLYKEIVQVDEKQPKDIMITLASLLTQILLYSNKVEDRQQFLSQCRAKEISEIINKYFTDFDSKSCLQMLSLFKSDIKLAEEISR